MTKAKFTKDEMLKDLRDVLYVLPHELNRIYGGTASMALVDHKSGKVIFMFDECVEDGAPKLDISSMEISNYMNMLYDFAFSGRLDKQLENDWINIYEDIRPFLYGIADLGLINNNADHFPIKGCLSVLEVAEARKWLDMGGDLDPFNEGIQNTVDLKTVALLAGLDEKTVRNLANPKAKNRLATKNVNGKAVVDHEVALAWLKARGYQDTVMVDTTLNRDLSQRGFWSLSDLGEFVKGHREQRGLSVEELAAQAQLDADGQSWIQSLEENKASFDQVRLTAIANALNLDVRHFVVAALKAFQVDEVQRLDSEFQ